MIYEECGNHRGQQSTRSIFFCFPANGFTNLDVFSLKPSASQGEPSGLVRFLPAGFYRPVKTGKNPGKNLRGFCHLPAKTGKNLIFDYNWLKNIEN